MKASDITTLVLAGGQGTRLKTVVPDRAKPMALVGGRPFLERLLSHLAEQGLRHFVICTGHHAEQLQAELGDGRRLDVEIEYSREERPLGTAGALRQASSRIRSDPFLAANGDSYCSFDLARFLAFHRARRTTASLWLVQAPERARFGSVELDEDGRVTAFGEKRSGNRGGLVNAGVYLFERRVLDLIPEGRPVSLETEVLPSLVGHGLCGLAGEGPLLDIGTPESYAAAQAYFAGEVCR